MGPVWALDDELRAQVARALQGFERRPASDAGHLKQAAVAITVVRARTGRAAYLLTHRSTRLRRHSGQWALPGGRLDEGETAVQAALRELHEELGIPLPVDCVLGLLDDYVTRSGYVMTPVVVWGAGAGHPVPNPDEVASVHYVPLDHITRPENPIIVDEPGNPDPVMRLRLQNRFIHAPTAAVLYQFAEVCLCGRATRVAHLGQPRFTWR
jgi:8-oxo-dGTP pyrophosphatase MutT (NUDIX family)